MVIPQTRTAKLCRESCVWLSASQGLLPPLCRSSTSNAAKAEPLKSSKTQLTPVTIFSVYCHLASASGAWWQKLRDWGGASSLRPSGSLTQTQFHNIYKTHLLTVKHSLFSSSVLMLHVYTRYNPLAHPCSYYYLLSPSILFCTSYLFCTFYSIAHFTLYFSSCIFCSVFFFYLYVCSCVVLLLFNFNFFVLSTERTWLDLHFTSDYTLYNLVCDE